MKLRIRCSPLAGVSGVIDGFEEMAFLMREGDNVVATLPYDIAYGEDGAGDDIPPYATLVYDRYEIVSVSEPKKCLQTRWLSRLVKQVLREFEKLMKA